MHSTDSSLRHADVIDHRAAPAAVGDLIIIAAFGLVPEEQVAAHRPKLVFVDHANRIQEERAHIPVQSAWGETIAA